MREVMKGKSVYKKVLWETTEEISLVTGRVNLLTIKNKKKKRLNGQDLVQQNRKRRCYPFTCEFLLGKGVRTVEE